MLPSPHEPIGNTRQANLNPVLVGSMHNEAMENVYLRLKSKSDSAQIAGDALNNSEIVQSSLQYTEEYYFEQREENSQYLSEYFNSAISSNSFNTSQHLHTLIDTKIAEAGYSEALRQSLHSIVNKLDQSTNSENFNTLMATCDANALAVIQDNTELIVYQTASEVIKNSYFYWSHNYGKWLLLVPNSGGRIMGAEKDVAKADLAGAIGGAISGAIGGALAGPGGAGVGALAAGLGGCMGGSVAAAINSLF